jgi:hypothetical protein
MTAFKKSGDYIPPRFGQFCFSFNPHHQHNYLKISFPILGSDFSYTKYTKKQGAQQ